MIDRLKDDHENAKHLARGLTKIDGISLDLDHIQTNIVRYDVSGLGIAAIEWASRLRDLGVKAGAQEAGRVRMVTHRGIEKEAIEYSLEVAEKVAKQIREKR